MTAVARQLSATRMGAGRWRVELTFTGPAADDARRPRPHPREVTLRSGGAGAEVESLAIPMPSAPERFSLVLAVPEPFPAGSPPLLELSGPGWTAEIELPQPGLPAGTDSSRPAAIDYTARDFTALRKMLLAVVDERAGSGLADHPVSQTGALVEELAYLGDALSYSQDGVATEAYLASARRRISVRRHAELLDYQVGTVCSARVWVRFEVSEAVTLPAYTQLVAEGGELPAQLPPEQLPAVLAAGALVFETLEAVSLLPDPPPLQLASVHGAVARLAAGSTSATVVGTSGGLNVGQLVLIGPVDPLASPAGQVVRLAGVTRQGPNTILQWGHADAVVADQALTQVAVQLRPGNLVLADQAQTHDWAALASPLAGRRYWPELPVPNPAYTAGLPAGGVVATPGASTRSAAPISSVLPSAAEMLAATGTPVQAAVELRAGSPDHWRSWIVRDSLLDSGPFDPGFVVEVEDGGGARLRFGDGTNGMQPPVGVNFQARVRSGGGSAGNVGIGAIAHLVGAEAAVQRVRNPVPAVGGADPEPLATVRLNAPTAFRITDRAVAPDDYSAAAREVDGVTDATTIIVPSGTGPLARVRIYAGDWKTPTAQLLEQVRDALARRRPAGVAVDVGGAVAAPVTIDLGITIEAGWALAAMATTVEQTLGARLTGPGCFGFATTLYRSEVITWLTALSGVLDVTLTRFRFTQDAPDAAARSELAPRFGHIIRIDDDPTAPELGSVSFRLRMEDS